MTRTSEVEQNVRRRRMMSSLLDGSRGANASSNSSTSGHAPRRKTDRMSSSFTRCPPDMAPPQSSCSRRRDATKGSSSASPLTSDGVMSATLPWPLPPAVPPAPLSSPPSSPARSPSPKRSSTAKAATRAAATLAAASVPRCLAAGGMCVFISQSIGRTCRGVYARWPTSTMEGRLPPSPVGSVTAPPPRVS
eukprot:scaffold77578_cov62-Phaeocystis_antarctica.AAC.2